MGSATCSLCQHNPNRRCQLGNNFAAKQLEKQPLVSACGSSVRISIRQYDRAVQGIVGSCSSSNQAAVQDCDGLCLEVNIAAVMQAMLAILGSLSVYVCLRHTDVHSESELNDSLPAHSASYTTHADASQAMFDTDALLCS